MTLFNWSRAEIEARILRRADMVGSTFVSSAELSDVADVAFQEFYLKFVSQFEDLCVVMEPAEIDLDGTTVLADLPMNFLKVKGIRIQGEEFLAPVSSVMEIGVYTRTNVRGKPRRYWIAGTHDITDGDAPPARLMPLPLPDGAYVLECYYVPNIGLTDVSNEAEDPDEFSVLNLGYGGDEYVVLTGAMKLKDKEESDCSVIMQERKDLWESIERFLTPMDESMPKQVIQHMSPRANCEQFLEDEDFG